MNRITLIDLANEQPLEPLLEKEVQVRAYELYELRGKGQGFAVQDWLEAEAEVLARFSRPLPSSSWIATAPPKVVIRTVFPPCAERWKTLYRAAISETNKGLLPQRVSEAEAAVKAHGREIYDSNGTVEENEILEDALYTLRAFRTAWQHSDAA